MRTIENEDTTSQRPKGGCAELISEKFFDVKN